MGINLANYSRRIDIMSQGSLIGGLVIPIAMIFFGSFINVLNFTGDLLNDIAPVFGFWILTVVIMALIAYLEGYCYGYYAERQIVYYRQKYIISALNQDVAYIEQINPNKIGERIAEQSARIRDGLGPGIGGFIRAFFQLIGGLIVGFIYSWKLTLCCIVCFPILFIGTSVFIGVNMSFEKLITDENRKGNAVVEECSRNIKTVAAFTSEKFFSKQFKTITDHTRDLFSRLIGKAGFGLGLSQGSTILSYSVAFFFAVIFAYFDRLDYLTLLRDSHCISSNSTAVDICMNNSTLSDICMDACSKVQSCWYDGSSGCLVGGDTIIVLFSVIVAFISFGWSSSAFMSFSQAKEATNSFLEIINRKPTIDSSSKSGIIPTHSHGTVSFKDISYKYETSKDRMILKNISLEFPQGKTIGIVGPSGSGKSTIIKLLLRFYDPISGVITYDNVNYKDINLVWLRDQMAYVAQEPVLFSGTIKENILLGLSTGEATDEQIIEAAKTAGAHDFIMQFPNQYDTYVGELGSNISGGQKQRIAIARALIKQPKILVFDEATSALDSKSEEKIQEAIEGIRQNSNICTVIIAHRLSSIQTADMIYVIKDGELLEQGNHHELLNKNGLYSELWNQKDTNHSLPNSPIPQLEDIKKDNDNKNNKNIETTKTTVIETKSEDIEEGTPSNHSFVRLLDNMDHLKVWYYVSFIFCILKGFVWPLFSVFVSLLESLMYSLDLEKMLSSGLWSGLWLLIIALCVPFIVYLIWYLQGVSGERMVANIKESAFNSIIHHEAAYFDYKQNQPSIISTKIAVDARRVRDVIVDKVGILVENVSLVVISLIIIFFTDWLYGICAVIFTPLVLVVEYASFMMVYKITLIIDKKLQQDSATLTDYLFNIYTVYSYNINTLLANRMIEDLKKTADKEGRRRAQKQALGTMVNAFGNSSYFPIVFGIGLLFINSGRLTSDQVFFIAICAFYCATFLGINMAYIPNALLAKQATIDTFKLIDHKPMIDSRDTRGDSSTEIDGTITFKNVHFAYPTRREVSILNGMNFNIPAGSTVAFVGESGCGKSTIMSLIERMYIPDSGSICIDNKSLEEWNIHYLRSHIGVVFQEPILFAGNIEENIALGTEGKSKASEDEIQEISKLALCDDFIQQLPDKYKTSVGETGKLVSGGEKQRIALARALIRHPSILILDEATSALDNESQMKFINALNSWRKDHICTVITVAHRITTVENSDIIFFIQKGNVKAQGTHNELLSTCQEYKTMVEAQQKI
ncbi:hypothetical protein WA158_001360 [Blastocystis sp. Blastoise]